MKKLKLLLLLPVFAMMAACQDDCPEPTGACNETPPSQDGIICQAFFERWFYNSQTGTCEQIGYSGCAPVGFATQAECQSCQNR